MMLHTERSTRGQQRAFVRYGDLLTDWTVPIHALGRDFDLQTVRDASTNDIRAVHDFIDPGLRRVQLTWDDVRVPARLREVAEESWQALDSLVDEGGDTAATHARLDELRTAYADLYEECRGAWRTPPRWPSAAPGAPRAGPGRRPAGGRSGPRGVDRLPHGLRAAVPARRTQGRAEGDRAGAVTGSPRPTCATARASTPSTSPGPGTTARCAPGLTCVFRVKDEARNLPWVLPPVFEAVQHVVLVDNGSTDGTAEVAQRVVDELGVGERYTAARYPFAVARAGAEHLATPPDSVHSLT